jgi:hypothetical protein
VVLPVEPDHPGVRPEERLVLEGPQREEAVVAPRLAVAGVVLVLDLPDLVVIVPLLIWCDARAVKA